MPYNLQIIVDILNHTLMGIMTILCCNNVKLYGRIGFVTQDDVLFPHLTVRETLTYAAQLRLPKTLTKQQKEKRATDVIYELGLER